MSLLKKLMTFLPPVLAGGALTARAAAEPETELQQTMLSLLAPFIDVFAGNAWIKGAAVVLITFTVASFLTWMLFKLMRRIIRTTGRNIDDSVILLLRPPIYYSLLATGIYTGIEIMPLPDNLDLLIGRSIRTIGVIIWVVFFIRLAKLVLRQLADLSYKYTFIEHRTVTLFDNVAKIFIFGIGLYGVFVIWKIDMTAWLASAGIAGIAIGFAAKDTLSNLFAGIFILADAPYKVGDYIVLDRGERGKVMNIGLRSTRILTRDDVEITIPNSIIGNSTIINQSGGRHTKMRLRLKVGVAYGSDIDLVREVLMDIARRDRMVCKMPEPRVRFRLFGPSSLDFELLVWVENPELRGQALDSLNDTIYKEFARKDIEIPYAKQDVYIKEMPGRMRARRAVEAVREERG